ncbi:unnamed protein product, partial [Mesorhabditis belari]|uniref:Uncharacterized protein n=1 Tax=Mesorhabditis belari TaxID=2138241 RepID=A0AAF3J9A7_9BILA
MRLWRRKASIHVRFRKKFLGIALLLTWFFTPTMALRCLICQNTPDSTMLERFRITTRLNKPICPLEPIQCDRDQDVCVTITQHIGHGEYWIGSGCDRRTNFPQLSCHNVRTLTKLVQIGNYVQEQRRLQRVCVCGRDLCNSSIKSSAFSTLFIIMLLFVIK